MDIGLLVPRGLCGLIEDSEIPMDPDVGVFWFGDIRVVISGLRGLRDGGDGVRNLVGTEVLCWFRELTLLWAARRAGLVCDRLLDLALFCSNMSIRDVVGAIDVRSKGWLEPLEETLLFKGEGDRGDVIVPSQPPPVLNLCC
jgi:hypothetical protein